MMDDCLAQRRHHLLARIGRQYQAVTREAEFGNLRFPFTRIADPDTVLDRVAADADLQDRLHGKRAEGNQLHLPYWAELWESAVGIGMHLVERGAGEIECKVQNELNASPGFSPSPPPSLSRLLGGCSILDLGCGMGMSGTVAAGLGAKVMFADLERPALLFARLNSLPWHRRVRTRQLDWQRDRLHEQFDLILGADILYERLQWPFLEGFWRAHLREGGQVLLGEPGRQTGDMFIDWITERGWRLTITEVAVKGRARAIRIFAIELIR